MNYIIKIINIFKFVYICIYKEFFIFYYDNTVKLLITNKIILLYIVF